MMRILTSEFVTSAVAPGGYPPGTSPEIAFCGRSNVGKSSLINTLCGRKTLAKTSGKPGKTRTINFINLRCRKDETDFLISFTDLPGYGYAKVSKTERAQWKIMIETYLKKRNQLSGLIVLVDIRHPADEKDIVMVRSLELANHPYLIVATKSDKIPKLKLLSVLKKLSVEFDVPKERVLAFSSLKKSGIDQVLQWIESVTLPHLMIEPQYPDD